MHAMNKIMAREWFDWGSSS